MMTVTSVMIMIMAAVTGKSVADVTNAQCVRLISHLQVHLFKMSQSQFTDRSETKETDYEIEEY